MVKSEVKFHTQTNGPRNPNVERIVHIHAVVVPEGFRVVLGIDQRLVLGSSQVAVIIRNTGESVDRIDVSGVEQVAYPEINVDVVAAGIVTFSLRNGPILVQVEIKVELPRQSATVDRSFRGRADLTSNRGCDG